ncbi:MAG: DUF4383 domain-containing protein [Armatimonadota bacterium]
MIRTFSLVYGIVFLLVGILGFIPGLVQPAAHLADLRVDANHGMLLGLFPVNLLHNLVHIAIGIWGIVAARTLEASRTYGKSMAVFYGLLTVLGLIPATSTLFGLVPIHGNDVWLHAAAALIAAYFGWVATPTPSDREAPGEIFHRRARG